MNPTASPTRGPQFTSRPRDDDRPTRKPLTLWDRGKYLVLLAALFWFFVWAAIADNPRLPKILVFLVLLSIVLGTIFDTSPALALVELPSRIVDALPFVFQLMFGALFIIIEFGALFWLLTRGGVDVYYPDDIKTRFTDV